MGWTRTIGLAASGIAFAGITVLAAASPSPAREGVKVAPATVKPGQSLTISAPACPEPAYAASAAFEKTVRLRLYADTLVGEARIAKNTAPGTDQVYVRCKSREPSVASFRVTGTKPGPRWLRVTPRRARSGQDVTIRTPAGCGEGTKVKSSAFEQPVRLDGSVEDPVMMASAEIAYDAAPGPHTVYVNCEGGRRTTVIQVTGGDPGPDTGGGAMAHAQESAAFADSDGGPPFLPLVAGGLAVTAAAAALVIRRRRVR